MGSLGVLGAGCDRDGDGDETSAGSTSSTAPSSSSSAPPAPAPAAVAVVYSRTYLGGEKPEPPQTFHAEFSLDGASFRMTADDGSRDLAYDAARGTASEWSRAEDGPGDTFRRISGLASGGPDHHGLSDGVNVPLATLVRALGRAGDSRVTTTTVLGRPAWHYDGPWAGDMLGDPVEDHVVADVDQASGVLLREEISAKGRPTRRLEATSIESRPTEDRSRYRPTPPPSAKFEGEDDHGFVAMTLDELAGKAGYDVLVPGDVPAGFELDEVLFDEKKQLRTGAEAGNPAPARVTSLRWRGPNGTSFTVTLRPENGDPQAKREGAVWADPFGSEGTVLEAEKVSLPLEGRPALEGEVVVSAPAVPHLWGVTGDLVVTVDGDLDAAGLKSVAGSLRAHPKPAADPAPTRCAQIGFTPNSDDVAGNIMATGMSCEEASAVVRRAREEHEPAGGPRNFRLESFTCRAVRQDTALEGTAYRCEDGNRRVTWEKT